jgi:outer membrane protein OmpA-like peptidoglycan-associated protein
MTRTRALFLAVAVCAAALPFRSIALAQAGFSLDRFQPAEHGSDWFAGESLDLRGELRPSLGLTLDWAHKPLVLYDAQGDEIAAIVSDQLYAHVGGALVLWDRVRLGLNVPIALVTASDSATVGGVSFGADSGASLGDLRLAADVRLLGEYGDAATLAAGVQLHLPTGDSDKFTGDGSVRFTPRLMLAGDVALFAYSARLAFNYRANDDGIAGIPTGNELQFVATAGLRVLDRKLLIGPELWGSTVLQGGGAFEKETTPFEVVFGGHYRHHDFIFALGVGPGLTRGLGAPSARVLASVEWFPEVEDAGTPEPEPSDRDQDGVLDAADACPDTPGVKHDDPKKNGCPIDRDRDRDGIIDREDACPDDAGEANEDPTKHGCPPDRDGDGVFDDADACPDTPGVPSDDPKLNGCPGDRDGDGIADPQDACPEQPGEANEDPSKNGCPKARIEKGQIKILEMIQFKTNSAEILIESADILEAVRAIMSEHPEIGRISIEGHTDNVGSPAYNKKLSERRAASVVKWLTDHRIEKRRLESHGLGLERPIDSNFTSDGRDRNRRVEFHIREVDGKPTGDDDTTAVEEK